MKNKILICVFLICMIGNSQCEKEILEKENYYYVGCLNYEGNPEGDGDLKTEIEGQFQIYSGEFKSGQFYAGEVSIKFKSGDLQLTNYLEYPNLISYISYKFYNGDKQETMFELGEKVKEIYEFSNGNKNETIFELGEKVKEIKTNGPGDKQGLVIEKRFLGHKTIEIRNIDNNRVPEDIIGDKEFIDIDLIQHNNQFRIPIEFPTKEGNSLKVSILFDTGATGFMIGQKLYQDLLKKCEVVDLNVKTNISGVGSQVSSKYIQIKEIKIGGYLIKNIVAVVPLDKDDDGNYINDMLVGIGVLKKFKEVTWSLNNSKMRFFK